MARSPHKRPSPLDTVLLPPRLCVYKGLNLSMYEYKELVMNPTSQSLNQSKRSMEQTWEVKSSSTCSMLNAQTTCGNHKAVACSA